MRPLMVISIGSVPAIVALVSCGGGRGSTNASAGGGGLSGGASDGGVDPDVHFSFDASTTCGAAQTCASVKAGCGPIGDGCGGLLQCGTCVAPDTCGGGGTPSNCGGDSGCVPTTCAKLGFDCGPAGDGCGGLLHCGTCAAPDVCGGEGVASVCGHTSTCKPTTCATLGFDCGPAGDGCGGLLDCGACAAPQTCGGGGTPGVCGGFNACVPKTCASLGADCGPVADGCGGLLQCGSCGQPDTCGGAGVPSACGAGALDAGACTNLCLQQVACDGGATTTVTGVVRAPNGVDPLYNALVYVPNAPVAPFPAGVSCDQCGAEASGSPLVSATTGPDGTFTLQDVPAGQSIPLVIQIGRWRRQVVIPAVAACADTPVPPSLTRLPRNKGEGDIPLMAFSTGSVDALECVFRKIGVDDVEFTLPASLGGGGRINLFNANGAGVGPGTPPASQLWSSAAVLDQYDMVLFPCEGGQILKPVGAQQNLIQYVNAGGRVFTTHYSYVWLFNIAPFSGSASFGVNQSPLPNLVGYLDTAFPKGQAFAQWLVNVGASTTYGRIPLQTIRHDVDAVVAPSQLWISADPAVSTDAVMHYTFNTPVGAPAAQQCGRVLFDDFHVEDAQTSGLTFPAECSGGPMTPQGKGARVHDLRPEARASRPTSRPRPCARPAPAPSRTRRAASPATAAAASSSAAPAPSGRPAAAAARRAPAGGCPARRAPAPRRT